MSKFIPSYKKVKDYIQLQIKSGVLCADDQLPSQAELMTLFDVSRGTIHKAISELVDEGVVYGIQGLGNFVAATQSFNNTTVYGRDRSDPSLKAVGFIIPYDFRFTPELLQGIEETLAEHQYRVLISNSDGRPEREAELIQELRAEAIPALIIYTSHNESNHGILLELQKCDYPFVLVADYISHFLCDFVVSTNVLGGQQAGKHLCELGHTSMAVFIWTDYIQRASCKERLIGFRRALAQYGLELPDNRIYGCTNDDFKRGEELESKHAFYSPLEGPLRQAIEENPNLSAIFCLNDVIARELLRALDHLRIEVPHRISVVGFDDSNFDTHIRTPLTTVRQDFLEIGRKAGEIILKKLIDDNDSISQVYNPTKLIVRSTTTRVM